METNETNPTIKAIVTELVKGKSILELAELFNKVVKDRIVFCDEVEFSQYLNEKLTAAEIVTFFLNSEIGCDGWGFSKKDGNGNVQSPAYIEVMLDKNDIPICCYVPSCDYNEEELINDTSERIKAVLEKKLSDNLAERLLKMIGE